MLGETPEAATAAALAPVEGEAAGQTDLAPELVIDALKALDNLLGRPGQDVGSTPIGRIPEALSEASSVLVAKWGGKLVAMVVRLIEEPEYRLAGAEEAIRQIVVRIERTLENHEQLGNDLSNRAGEARARIHGLLRALPTLPSAKARAAASAELRELLRNYPKWRNQSLLLQSIGRSFVGLRGTMTDQLREINFCRVRLGELMQSFAVEQASLRDRIFDEPAPAPPPPIGGRARCLLPAGCTTLQEAVERSAREVSSEELQALDRQVQAMIAEQFIGLLHVCMAPANMLKNVEIALEEDVAHATEQRINTTDAAALFFEVFPNDKQVEGQLTAAFNEAAPDLPGIRSSSDRAELCLLTVPATPAGERLKALARQALPDVPWVFAQGGDEIIVYRETPQRPLAELAQLDQAALDAYHQMTAVEHFTPHSRIDIAFMRN
jgi:hypothetical protein